MSETYRLLGGPGSPFSLKLRAVLRYRHLPHRWIVPRGFISTEGELKQAGKGMIPVLQLPDGTYVADSTPVIHMLEARHPGQRSVIPPDPGQAFLAQLIEDCADEWLTVSMFDYRWNLPEDVEFCARRQISGWTGAMPRADFVAMVDRFIERQTANRARACGPDSNRPIWRDSYWEVLDALELLFDQSNYLFGSRPSIADFGLYGPLCQFAIDPTPSREMKYAAPRVFQWTQTLEDASGVDGEWADPAAPVPAGLATLLRIFGATALPFMDAIDRGLEAGESQLAFDVHGRTFRHEVKPRRGWLYRQQCIRLLRKAWQELDATSRGRLEPLLHKCDCLRFLERDPGEVVPLAPA
ncbi:MAG: glutathione S-transferase [Pseudomonadota bacterium]|nr:glutathione S-transferase [Pseudomonadota bacterium]